MGYIRQLAGQTFVYGFGIVIPKLLNYLLLTPFYTRIFNTSDYGIITELYAYVVFLLVFLTYGMETGFFKYADKNHNNDDVYKTALLSLLFTSSLFLIIVFLNQKSIAVFLKYPSNTEYVRWIATIVSIDAFTTIPFAWLRLHNRATLYSVIRIVEILTNILANWFFLYLCPRLYEDVKIVQAVYNPELGVGYVFISNLFSSGIKLLLLFPLLFIKKGKLDYILLIKLLKYSYPLLIAGMAGTINEALDRILLKHILKENALSQLGIYGANYKLAVLMTLFVQMFRFAAEPFYFKVKEDSNVEEKYAEIMKYFIFVGMSIFLLVIIFLDYFILFIGQDFREGVKIVPIVLMANLFMGIFNNLSIWYKITGQTKFGALFVIIGALITIFINLMFIPKYGYYASAWGHFVSYSIMILICYYYGNRHFPVPYDIKRISILILIPLGLLFLHKLIIPDNAVFSGISGVVILLFYLIVFLKLEKISLKQKWKLK